MRVKNCIKYILLIVLFYCSSSLPANLVNNDEYKIENDASSIIESIENKYVSDKVGYRDESIEDLIIIKNELAKDATAGATVKATKGTTPDSGSTATNSSPGLVYRNESIIFTFLNLK